ncbi:alpha/beta hydrolase [Tissierella carlieri]|uniref:alpha/beta fold hydrolase n=1 Tax=Tissierella carlieri TaxID=689904 RepID=UPI001C127617|nr:alpha/beta hydrolase [Tissierella carlieri]MBU5313633.1 alpha/beta hydrolase [Tissierella carlieri]
MEDYNIKTIETEFGMMTYVDEGTGEAVLISHGIFGGYDQGFVSLNQITGINYRKISISRFGYPGSELPRNPTPENQAKVFNKLLDELGIEQAYILATSAGGGAGLRFALNCPERVKGLILLSSGVPDKQRSTKEIKELGMMGPPEFLVNDFPMWFSMKYFGFIFDSMMGSKVNSSTLFETMLPVSPRRQGIIMDTNITNIDMTLHYDEYPIEKLKSPVLVIHAKDDPMAKYENIEKLLARIEAETAIFETGGHTIDGNDGEVNKAIEKFIDKTK